MRKVEDKKLKTGFLQRISPETKKFLLFAVICLIVKLALTSWRTIYAIPNGLSDDGLMQNTAVSMLDFHWFGGFNAFTLCKRNVFSFYLALINALGIPMLVANEILYFVAILVVVFLIKKYTNKKWLLYVVFGLLFFNPATFATATSVRIYRDAVYPAVILITIGSLFHVMTNIKNRKSFKGWFIFYVISLTVFWFMREESIWIAPVILVCSLVAILLISKNKEMEHKKQAILKLIFVPVVSILVVSGLFRILNFAVYGNFVVTEDQAHEYQDFYNAVGEISSDERTDTIDFPKEIREKIYEISPTFATIKDTMEQEIVPALKVHGDNPEELNAGWTTWAVRQAMAADGYYKNAETANNFYKQVAHDIKTACDEGKMECTNKKSGLFSTLMSNVPRLTGETFDNLKYVYTFSGTNVQQQYSEITPTVFGEVSEILTGENVMLIGSEIRENLDAPTHYTMVDRIKIKILVGVRVIYEYVSPALFFVSVVAFVVLGVKYLFVMRDGKKFYERPQFDLIIFAGCSLVALLIRCLIVAYLNITAFYATSDLYLYSGYSLILVFDALVLALVVVSARDIIKRRKKRDDRKKK